LLETVEQVYLVIFEDAHCEQTRLILQEPAHVFVFKITFLEQIHFVRRRSRLRFSCRVYLGFFCDFVARNVNEVEPTVCCNRVLIGLHKQLAECADGADLENGVGW